MRDSGHKGRLALPDLPPRMVGVEHLGVHAVVLRVKGPAAAPLIQVAQESVRLVEAQAAPEVLRYADTTPPHWSSCPRLPVAYSMLR